MGNKDLRTGFLFGTPSFVTGVARLVDLWGTFDGYNDSASEEEADAIALYSDWRITGQDLRDAMNDFGVHRQRYSSGTTNLSETRHVFDTLVPGATKIVCCTCGGPIDRSSAAKMAGYAVHRYSTTPNTERWRCVGENVNSLDDSAKKIGERLE